MINKDVCVRTVRIFQSAGQERLGLQKQRQLIFWAKVISAKLREQEVTTDQFLGEVSYTSGSKILDERKIRNYLSGKLTLAGLETDGFKTFLKEVSQNKNIMREKMREVLDLQNSLLNKLQNSNTINEDEYLKLIEQRSPNEMIDRKQYNDIIAKLNLGLKKEESDLLFADLSPNDEGRVKLGDLMARIKVKNSEEILQKQRQMQMRKAFVRDVMTQLKRKNLKYEEYFTNHLQRGEIQVDKFALQLHEIKYDLEKNSETYSQIIYELTEETDDVSYKKLCEMFNIYQEADETLKERYYWIK